MACQQVPGQAPEASDLGALLECNYPKCWLLGWKGRNAIMEGACGELSLINLSCLIPFPPTTTMVWEGLEGCPVP